MSLSSLNNVININLVFLDFDSHGGFADIKADVWSDYLQISLDLAFCATGMGGQCQENLSFDPVMDLRFPFAVLAVIRGLVSKVVLSKITFFNKGLS